MCFIASGKHLLKSSWIVFSRSTNARTRANESQHSSLNTRLYSGNIWPIQTELINTSLLLSCPHASWVTVSARKVVAAALQRHCIKLLVVGFSMLKFTCGKVQYWTRWQWVHVTLWAEPPVQADFHSLEWIQLSAEHKAGLCCTSIETCGWKLLPGGLLYTTSFSDRKDKQPQ